MPRAFAGEHSGLCSRREDELNEPRGGEAMAKKNGDGVYRVIDVIGTSKTSWEEAAKNAVETASKSLRDIRIAEVAKMDVRVDNGKVVAYRTRLQLSFKYEG
jgi:flavin-binding protein dodecin